MMPNALMLAESQYRTYVESAPLLPVTEWWHALLLGLLLLGIVAAIVALYVFDSVELRTGTAVTLCALRLAALAGLVLFFLNLEKRTEKQVTRNSRVSILVDTSSSMATLDGETSTSSIPARRIDAALDALAPDDQAQTVSIIDRLRSEHEVAVYKFSEEAQPELLATYPSQRPVMSDDEARGDLLDRQSKSVSQGRRYAIAGLVMLGISLAAGLGMVAATWLLPIAGNGLLDAGDQRAWPSRGGWIGRHRRHDRFRWEPARSCRVGRLESARRDVRHFQ